MTRRAFTLMEVLVATALIMVLVGAMFAFLFDMLDARRRALAFSARQRAADVLITRLESDLLTSLVGDGRVGSGVAGDETRVRVLSRSVPVHLAERGAGDPAVLGDLIEAEYAFDEGGRGITLRRGGHGAPGPAAPLGGDVFRVRFRYHDGAAWRDRFDSRQAGYLPSAVEVAVWFDPWPGYEPEPEDDFGFAAGDGTPGRPGWPDRTLDDGGFDESEFAMTSDLDAFDEPVPDRIRVIVIPDAGPGAPDGTGDGGETGP